MALNKNTLIDEILSELKTVSMNVAETDSNGSLVQRTTYPFDVSKDGNRLMSYSNESVTGIEALVKILVNKTIEHILENLEINGIQVTLNTSLNSIFSQGVPVPTDGGAALKVQWAALTAGGVADIATQNNDGTGLVK